VKVLNLKKLELKSNDPLFIIQEGKSEYKIIVGEKVSQVELYAADELQSYMYKISGCRIPIKRDHELDRSEPLENLILVGSPDSNDLTKDLMKKLCLDISSLGEEGFIIKSVNSNLILAGVDERGTLYSVYTFLEDFLGVRFFYSDDEVIPAKKTITLEKINVIQRPSFKFRIRDAGHDSHEMINLDHVAAEILWMAKLKLNYFLIFIGHEQDIHDWNSKKGKLLPALKKTGVRLIVCGHCWKDFLPEDKYFKDHPEWYCLINGKRVPMEGRRYQFCLSNEEAVKTFTENVLEFLRENPEIDILALWPNDGGVFCECEECSRLPINDNHLRFLNKVSKAINTRVRAGIKVIFLAYANHLYPPKNTEPSENIIIQFCGWGRNYAFPFTHPAYEEWRRALEEWNTLCKKTMSPLVVHEKYARIGGMGYHPLPLEVCAEDLKYFKKLELDGVDFQAEFENWWAAGLHTYCLAKMLWNTNIKREEILQDYYEKYYQKAKGPMKEHFECLEKAMPDLQYWIKNSNLWHVSGDIRAPYYSEEWIDDRERYNERVLSYFEECGKHLKEAEKLANNPTILERIKKAEKAFQFERRRRLSVRHQLRAQRALTRLNDALSNGWFKDKNEPDVIFLSRKFSRECGERALKELERALKIEKQNLLLISENKDKGIIWDGEVNITQSTIKCITEMIRQLNPLVKRSS